MDADSWMLRQAEKLASSQLEKRTGMSRDRSSYI
tara:strand:+ start:2996 stop:3097 length:102 start_codon:yes stop_codon:yes gene_type:complete